MNISVIIPIYNAEKFLDELFESLEKNHFEEGDEILLIDNGSSDKGVEMCKLIVEKEPKLYRYLLYTEKADSYAARNFGVRNAHNEVLVFTDSDCKPKANWIKMIKQSIKPGEVVAGKITLEKKIDNVWENFDSIAHLQSSNDAKNNNVATANMAVYLTDYKKVGFFTERFSGGDFDWSQRAVDKGLKIVFHNDVEVLHPSRNSLQQILKKEQRIAYGIGYSARLSGKSFLLIKLKMCLKVLKIDTNIRYRRKLKKLGMNREQLHEFDNAFWKIRFDQIKYMERGYKGINARSMNLK